MVDVAVGELRVSGDHPHRPGLQILDDRVLKGGVDDRDVGDEAAVIGHRRPGPRRGTDDDGRAGRTVGANEVPNRGSPEQQVPSVRTDAFGKRAPRGPRNDAGGAQQEITDEQPSVWRGRPRDQVGGARGEHDVAAVGGEPAEPAVAVTWDALRGRAHERGRPRPSIAQEDVGAAIRVARSEVVGQRCEGHVATVQAHRRQLAFPVPLDSPRAHAHPGGVSGYRVVDEDVNDSPARFLPLCCAGGSVPSCARAIPAAPAPIPIPAASPEPRNLRRSRPLS